MAVLLIEDGYFYISKGASNYSFSMIVFGYNPKLSLLLWILRCFAAKTAEAATRGVLKRSYSEKNFANFKGKHLYWSLFLKKLQAWESAALLKRDSNTGVFLRNLRNF